MVIPPPGSSLSNCFTAGEISLLPGTITAHSKFPELAPDDLPVAKMGGYCGSNECGTSVERVRAQLSH